MIKKSCCSRFYPHKFVHLKFFWTQFKNVHLRGSCSLRPCISRPYCNWLNKISKSGWNKRYPLLCEESEKKRKKNKRNWPSGARIWTPDFQQFSRPWFEFSNQKTSIEKRSDFIYNFMIQGSKINKNLNANQKIIWPLYH